MTLALATHAPVATASAFTYTATGLQVSGTPTFEQWLQTGDELWYMKQSVCWLIGDWLNFGEHAYGQKYSQVLDETRYTLHSLQNIAYTCNAIPVPARRENVSFSGHSEVASLPEDKREMALDKLASREWNRDRVREYKRELKGEGNKPKLEIVPHRIIGMAGDSTKTVIQIEVDSAFGTVEVIRAYRKAAA